MFREISVVLCCLCLSAPAWPATYLIESDLIGAIQHYNVQEKDNLYEIARRFDIGIVELLSANPGIDPWIPKPGTSLTITTMHILPPTPRKGIVINLPELRLFYYMDNGKVMTFPIGIGRQGWQTPVAITKIIRKRKNPAWVPPASIRAEDPTLPDVFPPGPDNPLGEYALDLGLKNILIHGTNRPYGVGKRSSHGCIRLYPEDIAELYKAVKMETAIAIIDMPFKIGWKENKLFLEVTPTQHQIDTIADYRQPLPVSMPDIYTVIDWIANRETDISWYDLEQVIGSQNGIPTIIGEQVK